MMLELVGQLLLFVIFLGLSSAGVLVVLIWKKNLTTKVTYLRLLVQVSFLVAVYFIFDSLSWLLVLLLTIFVMSLFLGKLFCGWLCPFGLYMDLVTIVRKGLKVRYRSLSERLNGFLNRFRYIILAVFVALPFLGPIPEWEYALAAFLYGPFRPWMVLLSPLEPLIVPWKTLANFGEVNFSFPYASDILFYLGDDLQVIFTIVFVGLVLVSSFFIRRFWCRFCPTGISLAAINRVKGLGGVPVLHLRKEEEKCTKCGICKRVCPVQVTEVYEEKGGKIKSSMCLMCLRCVEMCPYEGCLNVNLGGKTVFKSRNWLEPAED